MAATARKRGCSSEEAAAPTGGQVTTSTPDPLQRGPPDTSPAAVAAPLRRLQPAARELGKRDTGELNEGLLKDSKLLNSTHFSEVYSVMEKGSGQRRALKKVSKSAMEFHFSQRNSHLNFLNEVEVMRRLQHPGIVHLHEAFETKSSLCLLMDLHDGGDLFQFVNEHAKNGMPEEGARVWFCDLCRTVKHLHDHGVVHRDLKLQNILLAKGDDGVLSLKLADFGISRTVPSTHGCDTFCGTLDYIAPEVYETLISSRRASRKDACTSGYGKAADMWSLGVILYILLSGKPPFLTDGPAAELMGQILQVDWEFDGYRWKDVSDAAKLMIKQLMTKRPAVRLTIEQALSHPWLMQAELNGN